MKNQNETAGMTATRQTKWGWGAVALVGLMAATTIEGSLIITAASVALFAIGSYLGGYMELNDRGTTGLRDCETANASERRAA